MPTIPIPGFADPVSSLSHLAGVLAFGILAVPLLLRARGHPGRVAALAVFALGAVFLLSMSGVYHLLPDGSAGRYVLRHLDHAAIFFLIAATFTPVHVILFRGAWRWGMLALIWTVAATGITLKSIYFGGIPAWLGTSIYLAMGWIGAASGIALWRRFGFAFIRPLVWGALAYSAGAIFEATEFPVLVAGVFGPHELFHFAVLAGLGCHWVFISDIAGADAFETGTPAVAAAPD